MSDNQELCGVKVSEEAPQELAKSFLANLQQRTAKPLKVRINDNRSTMLSVRWHADHTKVSLHRIFLHAPCNVMEALACYLSGEEKHLAPAIKAYIEKKTSGLDYSKRIDPACLRPRGCVYDLQEIFDDLNKLYFPDPLPLAITWFGAARQRYGRRITFGLCDELTKLIKIHRILDHEAIPRFVVEYVVYHEMVHHVCPPYVDDRGIHRIHHREFKTRERQHRFYHLAKEWMRQYKEDLFTGQFWKGRNNGWAQQMG